MEEVQRSIGELLKGLIETREQIRTLNRAKRTRELKALINTQVDNITSYIKEQAKAYRQNAKKIEEDYLTEKEGRKTVIQEYREYMRESKDILEKTLHNIDSEITRVEKREEELYASLSRIQAEIQDKSRKLRDGTDSVRETMKEINSLEIEPEKKREIEASLESVLERLSIEIEQKKEEERIVKHRIEEYKKCIKKCKEIRAEFIGKIKNIMKEKFFETKGELAEIKKQNIFQRARGAILNTFSGASRFARNVIDNLSIKIKDMKKRISESLEGQLAELNKQLESLISEQQLRDGQPDNTNPEQQNDNRIQKLIDDNPALAGILQAFLPNGEEKNTGAVDMSEEVDPKIIKNMHEGEMREE